MLQEPADDALDADIVGHAGDAGAQAANAAHDQIDLHPGLGSAIERVDNRPVDQRVQLGPDLRRLSGPGVGDFGLDMAQQGLAQVDRRHGELLHWLRPGIAGHVVEQMGGIAGQYRIAGKEGQIRVDARRDRVVVARAVVGIAGQAVPFAPYDQRDLGVGLEVDEAVDDLGAGALQIARPADIRRLVEPRLQLDQRRDALARFGRFGQRLDDRRLGAGPVQGLLDRDDGRIARRLAQELNDDVEALIRVVDEDILGPDRRETIAAEIPDALGRTRVVRLEQQVRALVVDQLADIGEAEKPVDFEDILLRHLQFLDHELAQAGGHCRIDRKFDHMAAPPPFQRGFEQGDQIFGFFLDLDVAVPDRPEMAARLHFEIREQMMEHQPDQIFQSYIARRFARQPDEAGKLVGQAHQRIEGLAVVRPRQFQRDGEAQIRDEGEGMGGIDRDRRQDRKHFFHEMVVEPGEVGGIQRIGIDHVDAVPDKIRFQAPPGRDLRFDQVPGPVGDRPQLFGRCESVLARRRNAGLDLPFQAGDPDHVEFIQVAGRDREKAQTLQQRMLRIDGFFHDPLVKGEPGKFPVDKPRGIGQRNAVDPGLFLPGVNAVVVAFL